MKCAMFTKDPEHMGTSTRTCICTQLVANKTLLRSARRRAEPISYSTYTSGTKEGDTQSLTARESI